MAPLESAFSGTARFRPFRTLDEDDGGWPAGRPGELPKRMACMLERGDASKDGQLSREELTELGRAQAGGGGRE